MWVIPTQRNATKKKIIYRIALSVRFELIRILFLIFNTFIN